MQKWENRFEQFLIGQCLENSDSAHDLSHIKRVVITAKELAGLESANIDIILPAAWLHDCVPMPKDHPERANASLLAADRAVNFLESAGYEYGLLDDIHHAIRAHSYSAGIRPRTIEAEIVQDADRLDSLGAIGIARCLMIGAELGRPLYNPDDPFCESRKPDDKSWTIDHFYQKLFKLPDLMNTDSAKRKATQRIRFMKHFLNELNQEII